MSENHTPGPWEADKHGVILGGPDTCTTIATTPVQMWRDRSTYGCKWAEGNRDLIAECEANAALIAAAPDLLAMVIEAKHAFANVKSTLSTHIYGTGKPGHWATDADDHMARLIRDARAAIAKARQ